MTLTPTSYLVLAALQDGPLHGYAIRAWMIDAVPSHPPVPVATLYATIDRLAADGRVELYDEEIVDGRARRRFALTADGSRVLREEADRLSAAAALVAPRERKRTPAGIGTVPAR